MKVTFSISIDNRCKIARFQFRVTTDHDENGNEYNLKFKGSLPIDDRKKPCSISDTLRPETLRTLLRLISATTKNCSHKNEIVITRVQITVHQPMLVDLINYDML